MAVVLLLFSACASSETPGVAFEETEEHIDPIDDYSFELDTFPPPQFPDTLAHEYKDGSVIYRFGLGPEADVLAAYVMGLRLRDRKGNVVVDFFDAEIGLFHTDYPPEVEEHVPWLMRHVEALAWSRYGEGTPPDTNWASAWSEIE